MPNTSSADDCESQCLQLSGASAECVAAVFEDPGSGGGGDCSVLLGDALLHPPPLEASVGSVAMVRNGFYYNSECYVGYCQQGKQFFLGRWGVGVGIFIQISVGF